MTADNTSNPTPKESIRGEEKIPPPCLPLEGAVNEEAAIPLPPPQAPVLEKSQLTPERLGKEMHRLDLGLISLLLIFVFFLSSFAAINPDFWMHLATGKLIAKGEYTFGKDPFCYTTENVYWANHSWLPSYLLYAMAGAEDRGEPAFHGFHLVFLKALMMAGMALIMLRTARRGPSWWIPVGCVTLAALAMSPRLTLAPICITLLFLALTLYLLVKGCPDPVDPVTNLPAQGRCRWSLWLLAPLFGLWVNMDSWFVLGPLTVLLFLLGQVMQIFSPWPAGPKPQGKDARRLGLAFLLGLAACLVNPHHYRAYTLPSDLWLALATEEVRSNPMFTLFFLSPIDPTFFSKTNLGFNPPGLAYFVLAIAGVVSFVLNGENLRWWRFMVWLPFFGLSAWMTRFIPFFAVVAAPITALNFLEFSLRCFGAAPRVDGYWKFGSLIGRGVSLGLGLALLALAWRGWLHPNPDDYRTTRKVTWEVRVDPSWRQVAEQLRTFQADWRQQGARVEDTRGFHTVPDLSFYFAWFAPEEKSFFDSRYSLFPEAIGEYLRVRSALAPAPVEPGVEPPDSHAILDRAFHGKNYRVNHLVVSSSERAQRGSSLPIVRQLWLEEEQWIWTYTNGRTSVFGWKDPNNPGANALFQNQIIDLDRLAFSAPIHDELPKLEVPGLPQARGFWIDYLKGPPSLAPEVEQAALYLQYFEDAPARIPLWWRYYFTGQRVISWTIPAGAALAGAGCPLGVYTLSVMPNNDPFNKEGARNFLDQLFVNSQEISAAPLVLAVRAGRQAVASAPEDADAYLMLAGALSSLTEDQGRRIPYSARYVQLRQTQLIWALQNSLTLQPKAMEVHRRLGQVYQQMTAGSNPPQQTHLDFALEHFQTWLDLFREAGTPDGQTEEDFNRYLKDQEGKIRNLATQVQERLKTFRVNSENMQPISKARLAVESGLAKEALAILDPLPTNISPDDALWYLNLLVRSGRIDSGEWNEARGDPWTTVLGEVANGNYAKAGEILEFMIQLGSKDFLESMGEYYEIQHTLNLVRGQSFQTILNLNSLLSWIQIASNQRNRGELRVIRGLLALEQGDTRTAEKYFKQAGQLPIPVVPCANIMAMLAAGSVADHLTLTRIYVDFYSTGNFDFSLRPLASRYLKLMQPANAAP